MITDTKGNQRGSPPHKGVNWLSFLSGSGVSNSFSTVGNKQPAGPLMLSVQMKSHTDDEETAAVTKRESVCTTLWT